MSTQVFVAKSNPVKLTAHLYPDEGYILVTDGAKRNKLFYPHGFTALKVDEIEDRTYIEITPGTVNFSSTIANIVCLEKETNGTDQA